MTGGLVGVVLVALLPASSIVQVTATPRLSLAPATVTLRIHIPPSAENREMRWTCEAATFRTSGGARLDGASAAPSYERILRALPRGEYTCDVRVFNYADEPAVARAEFWVH